MKDPKTRAFDDPAWAWSAFEASSGRRFDLPAAAHLHRRAGFAASWSVLSRDVADGPAAAVDRLLAARRKASTAARPPNSNRPWTRWPPSSPPRPH